MVAPTVSALLTGLDPANLPLINDKLTALRRRREGLQRQIREAETRGPIEDTPTTPDALQACTPHIARLRTTFDDDRLSIAIRRQFGADDEAQLSAIAAWAASLRIPLVATNAPLSSADPCKMSSPASGSTQPSNRPGTACSPTASATSKPPQRCTGSSRTSRARLPARWRSPAGLHRSTWTRSVTSTRTRSCLRAQPRCSTSGI